MDQKLLDIANDTLRIVSNGSYYCKGAVVHLGLSAIDAVKDTKLIQPKDWEGIIAKAVAQEASQGITRVFVTNETTLEATRRLSRRSVVALNFASAKNPGGGFLRGTSAQEESLARSSGLYASLSMEPKFYERNKACGSTLYTDHAIYSPDVPVFKNDDGKLLEEPYLSSFITMPAPNRNKGNTTEKKANAAIARRVHYVMSLAVHEGHDNIVLGAWGCGVFRNNPDAVAKAFSSALDKWKKYFRLITFAICGGGRAKRCFEIGLASHL